MSVRCKENYDLFPHITFEVMGITQNIELHKMEFFENETLPGGGDSDVICD